MTTALRYRRAVGEALKKVVYTGSGKAISATTLEAYFSPRQLCALLRVIANVCVSMQSNQSRFEPLLLKDDMPNRWFFDTLLGHADDDGASFATSHLL
jgi:hypothetical protein